MNTKNYLTPTKRYKFLISSLHSVYRLINSTFELYDLIIRLTKLITQVFSAEDCLILMVDSSKKYSTLKCEIRKGKKFVYDKKTWISSRFEKRIIKNLSMIREDYVLGMPLVCEDIMGLIIIKRNRHSKPFDKFDQELLATLNEQAITGIRNLQLYEEQEKIIFGGIRSLATLLDMRVPQEYMHSPYFSRLVVAIAQEMKLDEKQQESLKYASILHDAGKADIPLEILTKRTRLTVKEYNIIKRHPISGAEILRPMQILKPVSSIIMHHHEKYDGTGYPSHLKKGQIPQGARVMAVADAFEAMVYGRPYRERRDIASALKEIKKKSGTQFDPKVVESFLRAAKRINTKKYLKLNI